MWGDYERTDYTIECTDSTDNAAPSSEFVVFRFSEMIPSHSIGTRNTHYLFMNKETSDIRVDSLLRDVENIIKLNCNNIK